jgi:ribosomal protein S18 acetylase RimI-like enzyme
VHGGTVVGAALSIGTAGGTHADLLALGVAPGWRRAGLAGRLLEAHVGDLHAGGVELHAEVNVAERDPLEPLDDGLRRTVARRLFERAGFQVSPADSAVRTVDPTVVTAVRPPVGVAS